MPVHSIPLADPREPDRPALSASAWCSGLTINPASQTASITVAVYNSPLAYADPTAVPSMRQYLIDPAEFASLLAVAPDLWPKLTALCDKAIQSRLGGTIVPPGEGG